MTDTEELLARTDRWLAAEIPGEIEDDPIVLLRELKVAIGFVRRLRAALATPTEPHRPLLSAALDDAEIEIERLRHALTNVAENLHGAGLISDVARADILRAGSATPQEDTGGDE